MNRKVLTIGIIGMFLIVSMTLSSVVGKSVDHTVTTANVAETKLEKQLNSEVLSNEPSATSPLGCGKHKIDELTPPCDGYEGDRDTGCHSWMQPNVNKGRLKGFSMAQLDTPGATRYGKLYMDHTAEHDEYITTVFGLIYFDAHLVFRKVSGGGECGFTIYFQGEPVFTKKITPPKDTWIRNSYPVGKELDVQQYLDEGQTKRFSFGLKVWTEQPWEGYCSTTVELQWKHVYVYGTQLPGAPPKPQGAENILVVRNARYTSDGCTDPDGDTLYYEWDFNGDNKGDDTSSTNAKITHFWDWIHGIPGIPRVATFTVRVRAFETLKDNDGRYVGSDWSEGLPVHVLVF